MFLFVFCLSGLYISDYKSIMKNENDYGKLDKKWLIIDYNWLIVLPLVACKSANSACLNFVIMSPYPYFYFISGLYHSIQQLESLVFCGISTFLV